MTRLEPIHPGEVLKHEFMEPFGLSGTALAKAVGVTPARTNEIVHGRRGITAETALRLARYFNTDARSWMNLQDRYELEIAARDQGRGPTRYPPARSGVNSPKACPSGLRRPTLARRRGSSRSRRASPNMLML